MSVRIDQGQAYFSEPIVVLAPGSVVPAGGTSAEVEVVFPGQPYWQSYRTNLAIDETSVSASADLQGSLAINGVDFTSFTSLGLFPSVSDFVSSGNLPSGQNGLGQNAMIPGVSRIRLRVENTDGGNDLTVAKAEIQYADPLSVSAS